MEPFPSERALNVVKATTIAALRNLPPALNVSGIATEAGLRPGTLLEAKRTGHISDRNVARVRHVLAHYNLIPHPDNENHE